MNKGEIIRKLQQLEGLSPEERSYLIELVNAKKKYGLVWEEKPEDVEAQLRQFLPVLEEVPEKAIISHPKGDSESFPNHILIEGDNLHALTALSFTHEGKVDVIYIDPPYNTGKKDFKYNDSYVDKDDEFRHSKWIGFMKKRLEIAKQLLSEEGVIFISIDDKEQAQLKMLCDEVFTESNFVGQVVWEKGKKGDSKFFSVTHDYILGYVKNKSFLLSKGVKWRRKKAGVDEVLEKYEELKSSCKNNHGVVRKEMMKWYKSLKKGDPRKNHKHYNHSDDRGLYFAADFAGPDDGRESRPRYDIFHPVTGKPCAKPSTGWRWDEETTKDALLQNPIRIHFGKDESTIPCRKSYLKEIDSEPFTSVFYKDGRAATLELENIIGKGKFEFPKDVEIIQQLISLNSGKYSYVLDFFAGSGTTLHATMNLNAIDGGMRKCILITNNENNICEEVTYARSRLVIQGYNNSKGSAVPGLLENNLRYYRSDFVPAAKTELNKRLLTLRSTELLCIKEDCFNELTESAGFHSRQCRIFTNNRGKYLVVVYHSRQQNLVIEQLVTYIRKLQDWIEPVVLYGFSPERETLLEDFIEVADCIKAVPLPEAIYNAYRATFRTLNLERGIPVVAQVLEGEGGVPAVNVVENAD